MDKVRNNPGNVHDLLWVLQALHSYFLGSRQEAVLEENGGDVGDPGVDAVAAGDPDFHRAPDLWVPVLEQSVDEEGEAVHDTVTDDVVRHAYLDGLLERIGIGTDGLDAVDEMACILPTHDSSRAVRPVHNHALPRQGVGPTALRFSPGEIYFGHFPDEVVHVHEEMRDEAAPECGGDETECVLPPDPILLRVNVGEVVVVIHQHGGHQPLLVGDGHCQCLLVQHVLE